MSPIDYMSIKQYQLMRFKGSNYERLETFRVRLETSA
jgi:hypothetical protein